MHQDELDRLYEKIHFHELEVKEKLSTRIQLAFAIVFTYFTVIAYMLRMLDYNEDIERVAHFLSLIFISFLISAYSTYFLIKAFWGNSYLWLSTAGELSAYHHVLERHKADIKSYNKEYPSSAQKIPDVQQGSRENIRGQFIKCATQNSKVNVKRSHYIHDSFKWMLVSALPFLIACIYFVAFDLDVSSPRKASLVDNPSLITELKEIRKTLESKNISPSHKQ